MVAQQNILQTTELYTLNVWVICYVNYISIKYMYGIKISSNNYLLYLLSRWRKKYNFWKNSVYHSPISSLSLPSSPLVLPHSYISSVLRVFERHIKGTILYVQSVLLNVTCISKVTELCKLCNKNHKLIEQKGSVILFLKGRNLIAQFYTC